MEVNVIFYLKYYNSKFFVEKIKLNEANSVFHLFDLHDQPINKHKTVFPANLLLSLEKKSQCFYHSFRGEQRANEYFDFRNRLFRFNDSYLLQEEENIDNRIIYFFENSSPENFIIRLEKNNFSHLDEISKVNLLLNSILDDDKSFFLSNINSIEGYNGLKKKFIDFYKLKHHHHLKLIYFEKYDNKEQLEKFIIKKLNLFKELNLNQHNNLIKFYLDDNILKFFDKYASHDPSINMSNDELINIAKLYDQFKTHMSTNPALNHQANKPPIRTYGRSNIASLNSNNVRCFSTHLMNLGKQINNTQTLSLNEFSSFSGDKEYALPKQSSGI